MATQRDKIWCKTLELIEFNRVLTAADIQDAIDDNSPSKRTIRNTLDAMTSLGLLNSQGGNGSAPREYYPQPPNEELQSKTGYTPRQSSSVSPVPYPGGKGRLSDWVIDNMPEHDTYIEVFGGTAGVLFNKERSKYEIYNDINEDLVQFFRILRDKPDELASWLQTVPYSRSQYEQWVKEFYNGFRPDDDIEQAGRFFAIRYMQYVGASTTPNGFKSRARRSPARTFDNARTRIHQLARRFEQVTIECREYNAIFETYDDSAVDVLFYADPPYRGSQEYYQGQFNHDRFTNCLQNVANDWMVSYASVPEDLTEYTVLERNNRHRMKRSDDVINEKLICNFDPEERVSFTNRS